MNKTKIEWLQSNGFKRVLNTYWQKGNVLLNDDFVPFFSDGNFIDEPIGRKLNSTIEIEKLCEILNEKK